MFGSGVRRSFTSIHSLPLEGGEEAEKHSHEYVADWQLWTAELDERGYSVDLNAVGQAVDAVTLLVNGVDLDGLAFFSRAAPSVENLARFLTGELKTRLADHARIKRSELRIWEADDAWASYVEEW